MSGFLLEAIFLVFLFSIRSSQQDCKVLSECGENLQWRQLPTETLRGRPGKAGAPGPPGVQGQKGERGETVNVTVIEPQDDDDPGPIREFLSHSMTWDSAKIYCKQSGRRLCRANEICIHENRGRRMINEVIMGDHWTPIIDGHNKWLQVGDSRRFTCYTHTETHGGGFAVWGTRFEIAPHKGYVHCCTKKHEGIRYRYIGKTATYDKAKKHCIDLGARLCHASEVCNSNAPVLGIIARDTWVPVNDRHNEWIQIGNSRTCYLHGVHFGIPAWGVRTDGSENDTLGFVLCCSN